jgi:signal transduction histidine kinase
MSEENLEQENHQEKEVTNEVDPLIEQKKIIDLSPEAAILCTAKERNPNYLSIDYANKKFYEIFGINEFNLIGKSYDFLFANLDLDYYSEDQLEYIRLIKSVKNFHSCSVNITLFDYSPEKNKIRLKVTFNPNGFFTDKVRCRAIFSFEKLELESQKQNVIGQDKKSSNVNLLKSLERTLRNERLLREIGSSIIDDLPIRDIAQKIAKILCSHLKIDRCLLHDYRDAKTNFVVESCEDGVAKMLNGGSDSESLKVLTEYINFQNRFFEKYGNKDKKSSLAAVEDISADQNFLPISEICKNFSITSQIAITTIFNGKVNGGIYIHQATTRNWLSDEIELMELVADQFSIALDRSDSIGKVMIANHALMEKTSQLKDALKREQNMRKMQNEFVALVSHEFKTPLQIIDSTREVMVRKIKSYNIADESLDKSLDKIKSGVQRMNGLIHSTLNLAKMESGDGAIKLERAVFDLKKFILDIVEKNSNLATNKNIQVIVKIDELPAEFNGDAKLLDHSITNIISNAVKYSRNDSVVKILAKSNDKKVVLRVTDQGIGIPKEDLSNIGQKFFRAKNTLSVAGTGIGLYLTKHFIELHGGDVLIESELNVGTSVTVTLPRVS